MKAAASIRRADVLRPRPGRSTYDLCEHCGAAGAPGSIAALFELG